MNPRAQVVIDAAVEVVRLDGLDALSTRRLATQLQVTPMALYRHVDKAETLVLHAINQIVRGIPLAKPARLWTSGLRTWAIDARIVLGTHAGVAEHLVTNWFKLPSSLEQIEALLAAIQPAKLSDFDQVAAVNAVFMFVLMRVHAEQAVRDAKVSRRTLHLSSSPGEFPHLQRLATHYRVAEIDTHFAYGLDVVLNGLVATSKKEQTT
jgi:AcrR family transcriptional regulator